MRRLPPDAYPAGSKSKPKRTNRYASAGTTRQQCHFRTHVAEKNLGKSGQDPYSDRMVVHDEQMCQILDKLDQLGIADNTIVMYSTDDGPENDTWPDGATTPIPVPRRHQLGRRLACFHCLHFMRWPEQDPSRGTVLNSIVSHIDMFPTLLAAAGNPDVAKQLEADITVDSKPFHVHLDGHNQLDYITGKSKESARNAVMYIERRRGSLMAIRVGDYKFNLAVQRAHDACGRKPFHEAFDC